MISTIFFVLKIKKGIFTAVIVLLVDGSCPVFSTFVADDEDGERICKMMCGFLWL